MNMSNDVGDTLQRLATLIMAQGTVNRQSFKPEFIRLPKPGNLCPWTGLSRSKLNELVLPCNANDFRPPVKSVCLRRRGAATGVRLIVFESLMAFLGNLRLEEEKQ